MTEEAGPPCKILVVEDHMDSAEITSLVLGRRGFEVTVAESYHAALAAVRSSRFDLLVCDLGLSDGDGCALLGEVKAMYDVRSVAVTGHGYATDRQRCAAAGFDAFLLKPVSLDELITTITSVTSTLPCHDEKPANGRRHHPQPAN